MNPRLKSPILFLLSFCLLAFSCTDKSKTSKQDIIKNAKEIAEKSTKVQGNNRDGVSKNGAKLESQKKILKN